MAEAHLPERAAAFDAGWLTRRRWFRSKLRPVAGVAVDDVAPLDGAWLLVLAVTYADGGRERYLVPAIEDDRGRFREPRDGEGAWRGLVGAMAREATVSGERGQFLFRQTAALESMLPGGEVEAASLEERRLTVEQSNTSVRLGERLILKLYRLLEPGTNPEVEVNAFLTDVGFPYAPPLAGWAEYRPADEEAATAVMLQALVRSRGDGWQWMLNALGSPPDGPRQAVAAAAVIGGITAEMHAAFASRPDRPGFPARPAGQDELRAWRAAAERELTAAVEAVEGDARRRLEALAPRLRSTFAAIEQAGETATSRIHGDFHLGQLLRTEASFMVVDFEGEPVRALAERRLPASPLRDVAGMLRSLDYAARTAERGASPGLVPEAWLADARSAFLSAYGRITAADEALLAAFEAEKACYEVRYEANNRPDWTWLPLAGLERLGR